MRASNPRDVLWIERTRRRYGRFFDLAVAQRTPRRRVAFLTLGAYLLKVDRFAFNVLGL